LTSGDNHLKNGSIAAQRVGKRPVGVVGEVISSFYLCTFPEKSIILPPYKTYDEPIDFY